MINSEYILAGLKLKNRIIRAGCFEGLCQGGSVTEALINHHGEIAAGGAAMTTVAYCSVSYDGRAYDHEMWMRDEIVPDLKKLTDRVHGEGAAASLQLGHCGFFASPSVIGRRPLGASAKFCTFRLSLCRAMTERDMEQAVSDFARSAVLAKEAGFDAVEIHSGHGYLMSQFLSPWTNRRRDQYGGSLENRLRFPLRILKSVRESLGPDFPLIVKMNQNDGFRGGLTLEDAAIVAAAYERAGADALVPSCGFTSRTPLFMMRGNVPFREMAANQSSLISRIGLVLFGKFMVQEFPFEPLFLIEGAQKIRDAVSIPVIYIGGVLSASHAEHVLEQGFPLMEVGRATVQNPRFAGELSGGDYHSKCDSCNRCIAAMDGGGVYCVSEKEGYLKS